MILGMSLQWMTSVEHGGCMHVESWRSVVCNESCDSTQMGAQDLPVVLIRKDKEALCVRGTQRTQALVDALIAMLHLLQHNTHDDDILNCLMLQKVHLRA